MGHNGHGPFDISLQVRVMELPCVRSGEGYQVCARGVRLVRGVGGPCQGGGARLGEGSRSRSVTLHVQEFSEKGTSFPCNSHLRGLLRPPVLRLTPPFRGCHVTALFYDPPPFRGSLDSMKTPKGGVRSDCQGRIGVM